MQIQLILQIDPTTNTFTMGGSGMENLMVAYGLLGMAMQELIARRIQPPSAIVAPPPGMLLGNN